MRNQPGKTICAPQSNRALTRPNPYTNLRRLRQSLSAHKKNQATKGHASCGLIVASASNAPPQNKNLLATQAAEAASSAATKRLSCCNLIPCTAGKLPSTNTTQITVGSTDSRHRSAPSHSQTLAAVRPTSSQ